MNSALAGGDQENIDDVLYSTNVWSKPSTANPPAVSMAPVEHGRDEAASETSSHDSFASIPPTPVIDRIKDLSVDDTSSRQHADIVDEVDATEAIADTSTEDNLNNEDEFVFHDVVQPMPSLKSSQENLLNSSTASLNVIPDPIFLPRLSQFLDDEQKMALAALCVVTFNEMMKRYENYEFIDLQPVKKQRRLSETMTAHYYRFRRKSHDEAPLMDFNAEDIHAQEDSDEEGTLLARRSSTQDPPSVAKTVKYDKNYRPFAHEMINPETIDDFMFLERKMDGNLALCYAIKTYNAWCLDITERIYTELGITPHEPVDLCKCLIPDEDTAKPSLRSLKDPSVIENMTDKRPLILWNMALILLSASSTSYDSRARSFLRRIAVDHLQYGSWTDIIELIEVPITEVPIYFESTIFQPGSSETPAESGSRTSVSANADVASVSDIHLASDSTGDSMEVPRNTSMLLSNNEKELREKKGRKKRIALMTAAAIGGGALIGITTGLAAPMLGAGIAAILTTMNVAGTATFLGGVGGTALLTTAGVLTGSTMALKMAKRTGGVKTFRFIPIHANRDRTNIVISITGWITSKQGRGKTVPINRAGSQEQTTPRSRERSASNSSGKSIVGATSSVATPSKSSTTPEPVKDEEKEQDVEEVIAGGLGDLVVPFMGASPSMGSHYSLCFDPDILSTLGDALKIFASEIISFSANQLLQQTILATILSAMNWPMWLLKLGYLVDNPWSMGLSRAEKAGLILADALCNNVNAGRPVTLVGYSLGARVIYHCLVELAKRGKYGLVEDAYLFGTPVLFARAIPQALPTKDISAANDDPFSNAHTTPINIEGLNATSPNALKSLDEWRLASSVVSGRLVNGFSRVDWVLGFLFRASGAGIYDVAGLNAVILDDVSTPEIVVMTNDLGDVRPEPVFPPVPGAPVDATPEPMPASTTRAEPSNGDRVGDKKWRQVRQKPGILYNIDITALVSGHMSYRSAMPMLMKRLCEFESWTDDIEVIEQMVGGEWMDEVDGWWEKSIKKKSPKKKTGRDRTKSETSRSIVDLSQEPQTPSPAPQSAEATATSSSSGSIPSHIAK